MPIGDGVQGAALTLAGGMALWAARSFVVQVAGKRRTERAAEQRAINSSDLDAALAKFENRILERFNGRYPSREIFVEGMANVRESITETRKYIGHVEERLSQSIAALGRNG